MSDMFRKSVLNKLPQLPPTRAPWADEPELVEETDEEDEQLDNIGELKPITVGPSKHDTQDYSPLSASTFFAQAAEVQPPSTPCTFRVYLTPPSPSIPSANAGTLPGLSGMRTQQQMNKHGTYLVCHHGGGASGLGFAPLAREVKAKSNGEMGVLAFDCRGHGKTSTSDPKLELDLSHDTLLSDFMALIEILFPDPRESPSLILLGHSMGAAPVVSAAPELQRKGYTIPGIVVLDVVEGTAVDSLPLMKSILSKRPESFRSVIDAIYWHVTSNSIRNVESARVSVPHIIVPAPSSSSSDPSASPGGKQVWRTDLLGTEPYWEGWYKGLSQRFLSTKCARLLVLAGQERLDRELMVGQMQGKFQLEVMSDVGHYLHEDNPAGLAATLITFWRRNTRVLVLPPKIGAPGPGGRGGPVEVKQVGQQ
ncbi:protein phosphatase methylesterase 1 [Cryptococcus neoformans]|nr:protein phosphatase methylesterase 1 [Cryptococcus neoformans var. grubii Bt1]OXC70625.1 protein phosphatase methylesterase 1 [Cryptococcus neoformans var. grubii]OXG17921.1 protein phosphatase methylesterase 1 [Cryptococcus neoformans var. grubii Ze90-1]OXH27237.1 protein phosphatase methylesterase 1 [Cryptococcus neoformans var. grubii]